MKKLIRALGLSAGAAATLGAGAAQAADCPIIDSRDWAAWIDAMPGVDATRTLHITGVVDMPTPGFVFEWTLGPADRRRIPSQTVLLKAAPPTGASLQMISTEEISFETEAIYPEYASIKIRCGDVMIGEITEIEVAQ